MIDKQGLRDTAREYLGEFSARHAGTDVHFVSKDDGDVYKARVTHVMSHLGE